jgi:hypothetical protein
MNRYHELTNAEVKDQVIGGLRLNAPPNTPPEVAQLMAQCWKEATSQRPSFSVILFGCVLSD